MKISDLFDVQYGINLELVNCEITTLDDPEGINFVARTANNNGVVARVKGIEGKEPQPAGILTCASGGSVLSTFLQKEPFYSGRDLYILTPRHKMTINEKLFYCMCIQDNAYRYNYGRQANKTLKEIELPDSIPTWVSEVSVSPITTKVSAVAECIDATSWKEFMLSELFDISVSKDANLQNSNKGFTPYVASSSGDNGVTAFIDAAPSQNANTLTVARNGSVGSTFYQSSPYCASPDDVRILTPRFEMTVYRALFIKTIIEKEKFRYAYGRKLGTKRIAKMVIKLPVTKKGVPNFEYMDSFIKTLAYSDRIC